MFGRNHFEAPKKASSTEAVGPTHTSPEALEMLQQEVAAALETSPQMFASLKPEDITLITNYLAKQQEAAGVAFTDAMLENPHETEGLEEEILVAANARLAAKNGIAPDASHA